MKQILMAITGASGAPYAQRLAQQIVAAPAHLHLIVSPLGRKLLTDELDLPAVTIPALLGRPVPNATLYPYRDVGARIASGSHLTDGMVICPCSSNRLAHVASGIGDNLIDRAAAVTLKQARRLILVHRETPLSQIDIANMLRLSQAGAIICPASPGFYLLPKSVDELVDFLVGRVLDLLELPHRLNVRWDPHNTENAQAPRTGAPPE